MIYSASKKRTLKLDLYSYYMSNNMTESTGEILQGMYKVLDWFGLFWYVISRF